MPEPGTLLLVGGGALALWKAFSKPDTTVTPPVGPPPPQCNQARMEETIVGAIQTGVVGAQTGAASGGGVGAGVGAGIGAGLATLPGLVQCGPDKIKQAFGAVCAKAVAAKRQLEDQGVPIPKEWNHWSCEQRLAFVAALPGFIPSILAGRLVGKWATDAGKEFKKGFASAEAAVARFGGKISSDSRKSVMKALDKITSGAQNVVDSINPFDGLGRGGVQAPRPDMPMRLSGISLRDSLSPGGSMQRQDVDFGFLGAAPGHRGGFNGFGWAGRAPFAVGGSAPTPVQEVSTGGQPAKSGFDLNKALDTGASLLDNLFGRPQQSQGGGTTVVVSGGTPSWVLPAAGLLVVGGIGYFLFFRKR